MAMSSTCYNPFLYGLHNEAFQKGFVELVPFLRIVCGTTSLEKNRNTEVPMATLTNKKADEKILTDEAKLVDKTSPKTDQECLPNKTVHVVVAAQSTEGHVKVTTIIENNPRDSQV